MIVIALLLLLLAAPKPALTPGIVRTMTTAQVCAVRWGFDRRHVTVAMRKRVFAAYGIPWCQRRCYETDHLVPRELGGADDERNLWPQPWAEARQKDRLENRLHHLVCTGKMSLAFAQAAIRSDWRAAHRLYVTDVK
jgi:hypothetical protein